MPPIRPDDHAYRFRPAKIRELRDELKLTQSQMADLLEIPTNTLSRWETGSNLPDANALAAIYSIAADRGVTPQFFEERRTPMTDRANRQNIVIHWDYQNFALPGKGIVQFAYSLKQYLAALYPQSNLHSAKAFTSGWSRGEAGIHLHNSGFEERHTFQNADANLIRDAETTFGTSANPGVSGEFNYYNILNLPAVSVYSYPGISNRPDTQKSVYVLIANDGDYANLLSALKKAGADVYVCGNSQCSKKLIQAVGKDYFIPFNRPYVVIRCLAVVSLFLHSQPTTKADYASSCKRMLAADGWNEFPPETGFGPKHPYARTRDYLESVGLIKIRKAPNNPDRIIITETQR